MEKAHRGQDLCGLHAPTLQLESSGLLGGQPAPSPSQAVPAVAGALPSLIPCLITNIFHPHLVMQQTPVDLPPSVPTFWSGMTGPSDCPQGLRGAPWLGGCQARQGPGTVIAPGQAPSPPLWGRTMRGWCEGLNLKSQQPVSRASSWQVFGSHTPLERQGPRPTATMTGKETPMGTCVQVPWQARHF